MVDTRLSYPAPKYKAYIYMNIIKFIIKLFNQNTSNGYDSSNPRSSSSPCAALYPMSEHGSTPKTYRKMNRKETELIVAFRHVHAFVLQV